MGKLRSLCISIPAYNEEAALPALLERSFAVAAEAAESWSVLVVDDGSTDGTPGILRSCSAREPRLRVVTHPRNLGIAETLKKVLTLPQEEWVFFIPGDGQIPPEQVRPLLPFTDRHDLIYGWRRTRADPFRRRLAAWVYNRLISACFRTAVKDVDSVVLFRTAPLRGVSLRASSVFIHAEFLAEALRRGVRPVEVPIEHKPRVGGAPVGGRPSVILGTFLELLRYSFRAR